MVVMLLAAFSITAADFDQADEQFQNLSSDQDKMAWVLKYEPEVNQWPILDQAYFYHRKGLALEVNDDIEGAKEQFNRSIKLFKSLDETNPGLVTSLIDLAYMKYLQTNDTAVYCPDREEAVAVARQIGDPETLASALIQLAFCFQTGFQDLTKGLAVLQEAAQVVEDNNLAQVSLAMIYNATGNLYRSNQIHQQAYDYYKKAYQLWLELDDTQDVFNMLHNMSGEAMDLGHWATAEKHVKQLHAMAGAHSDYSDFRFFAEFNGAQLSFLQGDFKEAAARFETTLALRETTPEQYFVKIAESQLAIVYFRLGQFQKSFEMADQYLADIGDIEAKITRQEVVIIHLFSQQKYQQALQKFWQVLDKSQANNRLFVKNAVALQALSFADTVNDLQNQASRQQLDIKQLELEQQQKQARINQLTAVIVGLFALVAVITAWFLYRSKKHHQLRARTDYLTGIANRRHVIKEGRRLLAACQQKDENLSIIIIDIDDFKPINDDHGHAVGDVVIQQVVNNMRSGLSDGQKIGRIGGEEFLMLLPHSNKERAYAIAEQIRKQVAEKEIIVNQLSLQVTVSLGVAVNQPQDTVFEELLRRADETMYQAKIAGKNQVQPALSTLVSL